MLQISLSEVLNIFYPFNGDDYLLKMHTVIRIEFKSALLSISNDSFMQEITYVLNCNKFQLRNNKLFEYANVT